MGTEVRTYLGGCGGLFPIMHQMLGLTPCALLGYKISELLIVYLLKRESFTLCLCTEVYAYQEDGKVGRSALQKHTRAHAYTCTHTQTCTCVQTHTHTDWLARLSCLCVHPTINTGFGAHECQALHLLQHHNRAIT